MANTVDLNEDEENNLLGFSNPNYHLDDAVNCNTAAEDGLYDELYEELDSVCNFRRGPSVKNRRGYANLDLSSMGIDLTTGPATTNITTSTNTTTINVLSSPGSDNNSNRDTTLSADDNRLLRDNMGRNMTKSIDNFLNDGNGRSNCPDLLANSDDLRLLQRSDSEIRGMDINSPDSNDSGIQATTIVPVHVTGRLTDSNVFGVKQSPSPPSDDKTTPISDTRDEVMLMPPGWERHEDADGPYYWHIKSGTIQRDPPPPPPPDFKELKRSSSPHGDLNSSFTVTSSSSSFAPPHDLASPKTETTESQLPNEKDKPIRFAVRSLGWVEIAEDDLTPERSSKAVNKCIVDLSLGRNDILDAVGRWGDGKDLFMDLDDDSLKLVDPENLTLLNTQPIHTIRVWGVGRDNGRDFAYVARDRASRKHMCHVFRCDTPARTIANTLRDICKRIMLERSMSGRPMQSAGGQRGNNNNCGSTGSSAGGVGGSGGGGGGGTTATTTANNNINNNNGGMGRSGLPRPTNLPTEHRRFHHRMPHTSYTAQSFPTPMEEPKKILKVRYAGVVQVARPTGMETLNHAVNEMVAKNPFDQWHYVHVAVAPSTITILEQGEEGKLIAECRVRYLSFLGIGKNVKHCAFIMRTAEEQFMAHVFYCEPSSGALCKTIEAACKLRYQKCLDAHRQQLELRNTDLQNSKGLGAALKNMLGSLAGRKARSADS